MPFAKWCWPSCRNPAPRSSPPRFLGLSSGLTSGPVPTAASWSTRVSRGTREPVLEPLFRLYIGHSTIGTLGHLASVPMPPRPGAVWQEVYTRFQVEPAAPLSEDKRKATATLSGSSGVAQPAERTRLRAGFSRGDDHGSGGYPAHGDRAVRCRDQRVGCGPASVRSGGRAFEPLPGTQKGPARAQTRVDGPLPGEDGRRLSRGLYGLSGPAQPEPRPG